MHTNSFNSFILCFCTIGPKCCVLKKGVHRKRNTQTRNLREKNSNCFLFTCTTIVTARKVRFVMFFPSLLLGGDPGVGDSRLSTRSWQLGRNMLGRTGGASWTFDAPVLKPAFNSAKISWLVFFYRDFEEQIEDPRMFDVISETVVKHVIIHVWLY